HRRERILVLQLLGQQQQEIVIGLGEVAERIAGRLVAGGGSVLRAQLVERVADVGDFHRFRLQVNPAQICTSTRPSPVATIPGAFAILASASGSASSSGPPPGPRPSPSAPNCWANASGSPPWRLSDNSC